MCNKPNAESFPKQSEISADKIRLVCLPIEHILKREKNKIAKKIDLIEKEVVEKSIYVKNTLVDKKDATKTKWVLHLKEIKNVKNQEAFPANKPRYSYWSKAK